VVFRNPPSHTLQWILELSFFNFWGILDRITGLCSLWLLVSEESSQWTVSASPASEPAKKGNWVFECSVFFPRNRRHTVAYLCWNPLWAGVVVVIGGCGCQGLSIPRSWVMLRLLVDGGVDGYLLSHPSASWL
jgi:hypothetical protein